MNSPSEPNHQKKSLDYSTEASVICRHYKAKAVLILVIGGSKGSGIGVLGQSDTVKDLPRALRAFADKWEQDAQNGLTTIGIPTSP